MTRMENKDIHAVSLEILTHIDKFCREKDINYFLDSGTLLGAARDGGFIPWDDDADIVMPRPDYERFVAEYIDSAEYRLYAPSRGNCFLPYARLCEMKRTYFSQVLPWTKESPGVAVDILPLDGAPDSVEAYNRLSDSIVKLRNSIWKWRASMCKSSILFKRSSRGFVGRCIHCFLSLIRRVCCPELVIKHNLARIRKLRLENSFENSQKCFYIVVRKGLGKYWRKEWFSHSVEMDLCGIKFPVPCGWDERLTAEYGDWRKPPPDLEQKGHVAAQTMWWRD